MPFDGSEGGQTSDALRKMDRVIGLLATEDRWCKGQLETNDGRRCIVGAMALAGAATALCKPILRAIEDVTGRKYRRIELFNDAPQTTHSSVMQVLLKARESLLAGPPTEQESLWPAIIRQWLGFGLRPSA